MYIEIEINRIKQKLHLIFCYFKYQKILSIKVGMEKINFNCKSFLLIFQSTWHFNIKY